MVSYCVELFSKLVCICLLIFQGTFLNLYLVAYHGSVYWTWYITDVVVIIIWCISLYLAYRSFKRKEKRKLDNIDGKRAEDMPDEIKYAFVPWLAHALFLSIKVGILFRKHAFKLKEDDLLGPNFLKIAVSCTPLVFLALVYGHHNAKPHSKRRYYIASLVGTVCLDLFDSIDLLEFLFTPEDKRIFPQAYLDATLTMSIINFFLPTFALIELRVNQFSGRVPSFSFKALYVGCNIFLLNAPNLIIRSILWHKYNVDVSVLIMKNIMCIMLGFRELYEYFGEDPPVKCDSCSDWYRKSFFHKHKENCGLTERTSLNL